MEAFCKNNQQIVKFTFQVISQGKCFANGGWMSMTKPVNSRDGRMLQVKAKDL